MVALDFLHICQNTHWVIETSLKTDIKKHQLQELTLANHKNKPQVIAASNMNHIR